MDVSQLIYINLVALKVIIINGPNLNLLDKREEAIYGNISFDEYLKPLNDEFPKLVIDYYKINVEGGAD